MNKILLLIALLSANSTFAANLRGDLTRYILMRDRTIVDQGLKKNLRQNFLDFEINSSSGLKDFVGDIDTALDESGSAAQTQAILEVLNKNINTERYLDLHAEIGAPLPFFKFKKYRFLPSLYSSINIGSLITVSNADSATDPSAGIYLKKDIKAGLFTQIKWNKKEQEHLNVSLYYRNLSDLTTRRTASEISGDGDLINLDQIEDEDKSISIDLSYKRSLADYSYLLELKELSLFTLAKNDTRIGKIPFFHARYETSIKTNKYVLWEPFVGFHFRKKYDLVEALYAGAKMSYDGNIPVSLTGKMSNQFITLMPRMNLKFLNLSYSLKTPFRNPQEKVWVPTIHTIALSIPFQ